MDLAHDGCQTEGDDEILQALSLWQQGYERYRRGDLDAAIRLYRESLAVHPTAEAHTYLGRAYSRRGRYRAAIAQCERAIEIDPTYGNPWNDIGRYLIALWRLDEAIPYLERALDAERYECPHYAHYNLGRIYERKGRWDDAVAHYREAMKLHPDFKEARKAAYRLIATLN